MIIASHICNNLRAISHFNRANFVTSENHYLLALVTGATRAVSRALTPLFGNGAGAHGIGKISGVLTKIGKFDIVLMFDVSIARLIPMIKLTFFLDI